MPITDSTKRAIAENRLLKVMICRKCYSRNPMSATSCRRCHSHRLRPKKKERSS